MGGKSKSQPAEGIVNIAENRRARHDFEIVDTYEGGLVLKGTEVKALRDRTVQFADAYALLKNGEVFLIGLNISPYGHGTHENHEPDRTRKVLLHQSEIDKLTKLTKEKGYTLVPLKLYFKQGWAKVLLGVAKGRTQIDKRQVLKARQGDREVARALRRGNR